MGMVLNNIVLIMDIYFGEIADYIDVLNFDDGKSCKFQEDWNLNAIQILWKKSSKLKCRPLILYLNQKKIYY
ncbi:hypothetical protein Scep_021575 [Stephania cephalantha]|uniref:Uncharacterized protein n=1 Tax=Stephania cephalantha TaxID=152367 RepID=A0AAP0I1I4_9MAGN